MEPYPPPQIDTRTVNMAGPDLLTLAENITVLKKKGADEYAGPCPFCGTGEDRFVVRPEMSDGGRWLCRYCTDGKWQDKIALIERRDNVGFLSACRALFGDNVRLSPEQSAELLAEQTRRQEERRQAEIAEQDEKRRRLDATGKAQVYYRNLDRLDMRRLWHERGLTDQWIDYFQVGFNPGREFWHDEKPFTAPSLTIPTWKPTLHNDREPSITWECIGLVHRILTFDPPGGKYRPEMSGTGKPLFNCDIYAPVIHGDVLLVEGEIKSMVTWAHVQDLHPTPTPLRALTVVGIAGKSFKREWVAEFEQAGKVYICLDPDARDTAGRIGKLLGAERCRVLNLPEKIDDMINAGTLNASDLEELLLTARGI